MRNYYEEFLQIKNRNTLGNEVSKVSKGLNLPEKQAFDTFDTNLLNQNQKNFIPEIGLLETLNLVITAGASFNVEVNDFQVFGKDNLNSSEMEFLRNNKIPVLYTLQQALLVKHLFAQNPECRQSFAAEVERCGSDFETVRKITIKWFNNLLSGTLNL